MSTTELKPGAPGTARADAPAAVPPGAAPPAAAPTAPAAKDAGRWRTPPVFIATLALAVLVGVLQNSASASVLRAALVLLVVPCALIDLERRIIPNRITGPGALFALLAGLALDPGGEPNRLLWAAIAGGFLLIAAIASPSGMGMGDVKLLGVMALLLGSPVVIALLVALLGNILGAIVMSTRRGVRSALKTHVPFGPYLAIGGILAAIVGDALIRAYLHG
jgi:prepilin signal peptidase PulO-like enzyme (type II secretory pathway)